MEMTIGNKWASEGCYNALRALVDAVNAPTNRAYIFRNGEENEAVIEEAERALSYYDLHGIGGKKRQENSALENRRAK